MKIYVQEYSKNTGCYNAVSELTKRVEIFLNDSIGTINDSSFFKIEKNNLLDLLKNKIAQNCSEYIEEDDDIRYEVEAKGFYKIDEKVLEKVIDKIRKMYVQRYVLNELVNEGKMRDEGFTLKIYTLATILPPKDAYINIHCGYENQIVYIESDLFKRKKYYILTKEL